MNETPTTGPSIPKAKREPINPYMVIVRMVKIARWLAVALGVLAIIALGIALVSAPFIATRIGTDPDKVMVLALAVWGVPVLAIVMTLFEKINDVWWPEIKRRAGVPDKPTKTTNTIQK